MRNNSSDKRLGIRIATTVTLVAGVCGLYAALASTAIPALQLGVVASIIALSWPLWMLIRFKATANYKASIVFLCLGCAGMVNSMVGIYGMRLGYSTPVSDLIVQSSGIFTYVAWSLGLLVLPTKRMLSGSKLPWLMDVGLIITAISAAGWFFLIAPQAEFSGPGFAFWLTFAYPVANLISLASVVAAISLGGSLRSGRGLLMLGIVVNVAGDFIQSTYMVRQEVPPFSYIQCLWLLSTLFVGLSALQFRYDAQRPLEPLHEGIAERLKFIRGVVPVLFLAALVCLAVWGNWARPRSYDVLGLNIGCLIAIGCSLVRLLCLIKDNADLGRSLAETNAGLDLQVKERTAELESAHSDLDRQKTFLRSVIDALPNFVVAKDRDGRVLLANRAAAELYGTTAEDLRGTYYAELASRTNPNANVIVREELQAVLGNRKLSIEEREIVAADGAARTFQVSKTPVLSRDGTPEQVLIVGTDISAVKNAERAQIAAREAAEESTRVKSEFLSKMSHEMRTPMNAVIGLTNALLEESLDPEQRSMAQSIKAGADRLLAMIDDVLDVEDVGRGHITVEAVPTNIVDLANEALDRYRAAADAKHLSLSLETSFKASLRFYVDPGLVKKALDKLISNAIKFTDEGSVSLRLSVSRHADGTAVLSFELRDTGIGISEEGLGKVFEPFAQGDNSLSRGYEGAGLGLSLCQELVRHLGGTLRLTSELGRGSSAVIELPVQIVEEDLFGPGPKQAGLENLKVLIVEDNQVNQMVLRRILSRQGCVIDAVANGLEALEWLRENPCDLVLMDCQMPLMDGLEATRQIRRLPNAMRNVTVIGVTANAMAGDRERCLAAGMDEYVPKPVRPETLMHALSHIGSAPRAA